MMKTSALDGTARRLLGSVMFATALLLFVSSGSVVGAQGVDAATVKEWREAAERGDAQAQYLLGFMYASGEGVSGDDVEAVKWLRKAAEQGHAGAQYNLGVMYGNGDGVAEDDAEAAE